VTAAVQAYFQGIDPESMNVASSAEVAQVCRVKARVGTKVRDVVPSDFETVHFRGHRSGTRAFHIFVE
jgi:hypothetical protein